MHGSVRIEMWSCGCASLGEISELVDVNAVFAVRIETFDNACDPGGKCDVLLTEGHDAHNV